MRGLLLLALLAGPAAAADDRLQPGEFPPRGTEHPVTGELLEADFLRRSGQFRREDDGVLVDFTLLPCGTILYLDAEADLRDVPLGTTLHFSMYRDESGAYTKVAAIEDEFSRLARRGRVYRLEEAHPAEGTLLVNRLGAAPDREDLGRGQFRVDPRTRVWKGDKAASLADLAPGDELLVNLTGRRVCTDIWAGVEARKLATDEQQKRHHAFLRQRGLAARIDRVDGRKLTVALLGDPASMQALFKADGIDPARWAAEHRIVDAVVGNEELRTYNPPVDGKRGPVLDYQAIPTAGFGCAGVRWTIQPDLLLEGFRKGRYIRLFVHPAWPVNDMPFGESLYTEAPGAKPLTEEPEQYSYRTDFANADLPWYRLKPGEFPPYHSHHLVAGELLKADPVHRSGQFRADRTGELVDFTLPPFAAILYLNAESDLRDLPLGTRYRFYLYQDDRGAFTKAAVIEDEFIHLADDHLSYRLDEARPGDGKLLLTRLHDAVKNDKEEFYRPPPFGRGEFAVNDKTRIWKGDAQATLADLAPGDELLLNQSGRTATDRGICTDLWVGEAARKRATEQQRAKHSASLKARGLPAWVMAVDGNKLTVVFFAADRRAFPRLLGDDPWGKGVSAVLADDQLRPTGAPAEMMGFSNHLPEGDTAGTYGCSGVRWVLESRQPAGKYRPGQVLRIYKEGWPISSTPEDGPSAR